MGQKDVTVVATMKRRDKLWEAHSPYSLCMPEDNRFWWNYWRRSNDPENPEFVRRTAEEEAMDGDAANPYAQTIVEWPESARKQHWTPGQRRFVNKLLNARMASTGETKEQAAEAVLKQLKEERKGVKEDA